MTPAAEISILWLNAGLSCDGDTIAMTGATQPSIEDVLAGAIPWVPKVTLYNAFLAPENGDEFVAAFRRDVARWVLPCLIVREGSRSSKLDVGVCRAEVMAPHPLY